MKRIIHGQNGGPLCRPLARGRGLKHILNEKGPAGAGVAPSHGGVD